MPLCANAHTHLTYLLLLPFYRLAGYLKTSSGWFLVSFSLPLKVYPAIFVLHESAVAYKPLDTTINAVCFAENIEILG